VALEGELWRVEEEDELLLLLVSDGMGAGGRRVVD
jgi:hypothetical protein